MEECFWEIAKNIFGHLVNKDNSGYNCLECNNCVLVEREDDIFFVMYVDMVGEGGDECFEGMEVLR